MGQMKEQLAVLERQRDEARCEEKTRGKGREVGNVRHCACVGHESLVFWHVLLLITLNIN